MPNALLGAAVSITLMLASPLARPADSPAPAARAGVATIRGDRIEPPEPIRFKTGKPKIDPASDKILTSVAATFETHPEIALVEIGVHTDSRGSGAYNKRTSQQRADEVRRRLIAKGVEAARLIAVGYGEERPIESNQTAEGRSRNRRLELTIKKRCPAGQRFVETSCSEG